MAHFDFMDPCIDVGVLQTWNEDDARNYLERLRWYKGVHKLISCPVCSSRQPLYQENRDGKQGYYQCLKNHPLIGKYRLAVQQSRRKIVFTVRTGTILERAHVPLCGWLAALAVVSSPHTPYLPLISGVSLGRMIGISQEPARNLISKIALLDDEFFGTTFEIAKSKSDYFLMKYRSQILLQHSGQIISSPDGSYLHLWDPEFPRCRRHIELLTHLSNG